MTGTVQTLKRRPDFLRAQRGVKAVRPTLVLQCRARRDMEGKGIRFGFTATRKLGGAVVRNRVKRRLRAAVRQLDAGLAGAGCDYVLIGRAVTATAPFVQIMDDLHGAMNTVRRRQDPSKPTRTDRA